MTTADDFSDGGRTGSVDEAGMSRRTVLAAGTVAAAGVALTACGSSGSSGSSTSTSASSQPTSGGSKPTSSSAGGSAQTSQVPVGGAAIVKAGSTAYVVAQPTAGEFVAHSAVCPHEGCLCNQISGSEAVCPCHGSRFNATTGAVVRGPAKTGLAPANVAVDGSTLQLS